MATITLGTNATTTLTAIAWNPAVAAADIAAINNNIKMQNAVGRLVPGAFAKNGRLQLPGRRGFILVQPGDYVAFDGAGWPIVVSEFSIANGGGWTHS